MDKIARMIAGLAIALFMASCGGSGSSAPPPPQGPQGLAPPTIGVQLASTAVTIDPGGERYACWSFKLPSTGPLSVISTVTGLPKAGVHHYAVFTNSAPLPDNPTAYDCLVMGPTWGLVTGGGVGTPGLTFPQGTAMTLQPGAHVVFQLHLLNPSQSPLTVAPSAINLVGSNETNLQQVGLVVAGQLNLDVPAHMTNVQIQGACPAPFPMQNVFALFPHMHKLGTHISMSVTKAGTTSPQMLLDRDWDFGTQGVYPGTGSAAQGDMLNVQCTFTNSGSTDVHFGESTNDEMCLGVFYYYPYTPSASGTGNGISTYCFQ
jgi:hypothetical protein